MVSNRGPRIPVLPRLEPSIRVTLLTDDALFAEGLGRIFESVPSFDLAYSESPADALEAEPDVLLLDSRLEGSLVMCEQIARESQISVILVAAPDDDAWAARALLAAARGVLARTAKPGDVLRAIWSVKEGVIWAPRRVITALLDRLTSETHVMHAAAPVIEERLSIREREIFHQAARGLGNKQLASLLLISEATVKVHLSHIFQKLGVRGRAELAAAYYGITSPTKDAAVSLHPPAAGHIAPLPTSASAVIRKS